MSVPNEITILSISGRRTKHYLLYVLLPQAAKSCDMLQKDLFGHSIGCFGSFVWFLYPVSAPWLARHIWCSSHITSILELIEYDYLDKKSKAKHVRGKRSSCTQKSHFFGREGKSFTTNLLARRKPGKTSERF